MNSLILDDADADPIPLLGGLLGAENHGALPARQAEVSLFMAARRDWREAEAEAAAEEAARVEAKAEERAARPVRNFKPAFALYS